MHICSFIFHIACRSSHRSLQNAQTNELSVLGQAIEGTAHPSNQFNLFPNIFVLFFSIASVSLKLHHSVVQGFKFYRPIHQYRGLAWIVSYIVENTWRTYISTYKICPNSKLIRFYSTLKFVFLYWFYFISISIIIGWNCYRHLNIHIWSSNLKQCNY